VNQWARLWRFDITPARRLAGLAAFLTANYSNRTLAPKPLFSLPLLSLSLSFEYGSVEFPFRRAALVAVTHICCCGMLDSAARSGNE
jgi:hypothetical protein